MRRWRYIMLLWCVTLCAPLFAAVPRADYQQRVAEAVSLVESAADDLGKQNAVTVAQLAHLLPPGEEVADGAQLIHIDNDWFHTQLAQLPTYSPDQEEEDEGLTDARTERWSILAGYLNALNERVKDADAPLPTDFNLEHDKLKNILARSEYKTDERQASGIQQWLKQMWERLAKWLRDFFKPSQIEPTMPGQGTVKVARVIIVTLLIAALVFALYQFSKWWKLRQPQDKKEKSRDILGVEITDETTTEDLLAAARALAQQGDYRGAIRRAYIALLYGLEQRGKLRLHRSKTNRDYLNALRHEAMLYPSFAALTLRFEQVWYGQTQVSQFDFEGFLNGYQQALKTDN